MTSNEEPFTNKENFNSVIGLELPMSMKSTDLCSWLIGKREAELTEKKQEFLIMKRQAGDLMMNELLKLPYPKLSREIVEYLREIGSNFLF